MNLDWFGLSIGFIFLTEAGNILPDKLAVVAYGHDHTVVGVSRVSIGSPNIRVHRSVDLHFVGVTPYPTALTKCLKLCVDLKTIFQQLESKHSVLILDNQVKV